MRIQDKRRGHAMIAVTCAMVASVAVAVSGCSGWFGRLRGRRADRDALGQPDPLRDGRSGRGDRHQRLDVHVAPLRPRSRPPSGLDGNPRLPEVAARQCVKVGGTQRASVRLHRNDPV